MPSVLPIGDGSVKGTFRNDITYVQPHMRRSSSTASSRCSTSSSRSRGRVAAPPRPRRDRHAASGAAVALPPASAATPTRRRRQADHAGLVGRSLTIHPTSFHPAGTRQRQLRRLPKCLFTRSFALGRECGVVFAARQIMAAAEQSTGANGGPRPADFIADRSPGDSLLIVRPCHGRAAAWLIAMVGDVPVDDRCLEDFITAALTAGFRVSLAFQAQPRVLGGLPAATDVDAE